MNREHEKARRYDRERALRRFNYQQRSVALREPTALQLAFAEARTLTDSRAKSRSTP